MSPEVLMHELFRRLRDSEEGANEHGIYWRSSKLVPVLRWFNDEYAKAVGSDALR